MPTPLLVPPKSSNFANFAPARPREIRAHYWPKMRGFCICLPTQTVSKACGSTSALTLRVWYRVLAKTRLVVLASRSKMSLQRGFGGVFDQKTKPEAVMGGLLEMFWAPILSTL